MSCIFQHKVQSTFPFIYSQYSDPNKNTIFSINPLGKSKWEITWRFKTVYNNIIKIILIFLCFMCLHWYAMFRSRAYFLSSHFPSPLFFCRLQKLVPISSHQWVTGREHTGQTTTSAHFHITSLFGADFLTLHVCGLRKDAGVNGEHSCMQSRPWTIVAAWQQSCHCATLKENFSDVTV